MEATDCATKCKCGVSEAGIVERVRKVTRIGHPMEDERHGCTVAEMERVTELL